MFQDIYVLENLTEMPYLSSTMYNVLTLHVSLLLRDRFSRDISGWKTVIASGNLLKPLLMIKARKQKKKAIPKTEK